MSPQSASDHAGRTCRSGDQPTEAVRRWRVLGGDEGRDERLVRGSCEWAAAASLPPLLPPRLRSPRAGEAPVGRDHVLVVITGLDKPFRTVLSATDYAAVRALGDEY